MGSVGTQALRESSNGEERLAILFILRRSSQDGLQRFAEFTRQEKEIRRLFFCGGASICFLQSRLPWLNDLGRSAMVCFAGQKLLFCFRRGALQNWGGGGFWRRAFRRFRGLGFRF